MTIDSSFQARKPLLIIFTLVGICVWVLNAQDVFGWHRAKYTKSAHGSSSFGVKRKSGTSTADYATGNCAHCHEQHASIGGSSHTAYAFGLFAPNDPTSQTDNFCFQCHKGVGSIQHGGITNYTYSKNFGGGTQTFTTIYDAFNPTSGATPSSHDLSDVQNFAVNIHRGLGFTSNTNACVVCHDVHTAQQNWPVIVNQTLGGVNTAIRRPGDYAERRTNLWGDENQTTSGYNERMIDYTTRYQAPFYGTPGDPVLGPFEPANDTTADGSNLPNFKNYCLGVCHGRSDVYSTERSRKLYKVDWGSSGDFHGRNHDDTLGGGFGYTIAPFNNEEKNYVLSCTDCHEPHGSENEWLLRTCVNGKDNISVPSSGKWWNFCTACHVLTDATNMYHQPDPPAAPPCPTCHYHGQFL